MIAKSGYLLLVGLLAGCAGGTTMRVVEDDDRDPGPVALAPTPESESDSTILEVPQPVISDTLGTPATDSAPQPMQGYAPYGTSGDLGIRRIGQWTRTGIGEARRLVIRDANTWAEFWSELGLGDRPGVDFSKDIVIGVAAGQRPTGGHEIVIKEVTHTDGELAIKVLETRPGPNCMTTTSLTQPVDVVVVPRVNARSWSFVEHQEVRGCQ